MLTWKHIPRDILEDNVLRLYRREEVTKGYGRGGSIQIMACGSFALDVPRRNLRSFSLVSGENEYNLASDWGSNKVVSSGVAQRRERVLTVSLPSCAHAEMCLSANDCEKSDIDLLSRVMVALYLDRYQRF